MLDSIPALNAGSLLISVPGAAQALILYVVPLPHEIGGNTRQLSALNDAQAVSVPAHSNIINLRICISSRYMIVNIVSSFIH